MSGIKILDAFKYYKGLEGQQEAALYLESLLTKEQRINFQTLYRKQIEPKPVVKADPYLYVKWSGKYDEFGLKIFGLYFMNGNTVVDKVAICSGQSYAQDPVWPLDDYSGSMRPCPEGVFNIGTIDDLGYDPGASDGLGQYVVPLLPQAAIKRSALLIHADRNRATAPGSAGCLTCYDSTNMFRIIGWLRQKAEPKIVIVDHGLGFLKQIGVSVPTI
jgi:hypothetical protein